MDLMQQLIERLNRPLAPPKTTTKQSVQLEVRSDFGYCNECYGIISSGDVCHRCGGDVNWNNQKIVDGLFKRDSVLLELLGIDATTYSVNGIQARSDAQRRDKGMIRYRNRVYELDKPDNPPKVEA